jgi:fatty-acyl-CoA synthase
LPNVLGHVARTVHAVRVLARAGLARPIRRPGEALRALSEVRTWGPLVAAVRRAAREVPDAVAIVDDRGSVTYGELDQRSTALAHALRDGGVHSGQIVGVLCRDHRHPVETMLACGRLGVRTVMLNTGFAGPQLARVVRRESVSALVYDVEFGPQLDEVPRSVGRVLAWTDGHSFRHTPSLDELVAAHAGRGALPEPERPGAVVLLTSGTTGMPRGTERRVRSGLVAADFLDRVPLRRRESTFIASPLFHGIGYLHLTLGLSLQSSMVLRRRFEAEHTLRAVAMHRCSTLVLVPTMLQRILELGPATLGGYDVSCLRVLFSSGSALAPGLTERAMRAFGDVLYNFYGSTEVATATVATPEDLRAAPGSAGRPPHGCAVRLFDSANRPIRRPNVTGRIFVSGRMKFDGYTRGEVRNQIGDLVDTGDLGHFDEHGLLFVDGREDDMVISGGENVYPVEVEQLLETHYRVREAAVLGVPDPEFGQRLRAYVVPIPGAPLSADELKAFVRSRLARHKVPRDVVLARMLPRTSTGKLVRRELVNLR